MTRTIRPDLDIAEPEACASSRAFASPLALGFVRIVMQRRGITEPQARQIYLDYINRTQPGREPPPHE